MDLEPQMSESPCYLSVAMMPAIVTAPIIPTSLYLNMVLESCFRTTRCMSSCNEIMTEKDEDAGMAQQKSLWILEPKNPD